MKKKTLKIGLVGCGFMGRTHSNAFRQVGRFFETDYDLVLKAVCARNPSGVQAFAETWGYDSVETDWRALVARPDIDLIDIATPNSTHAEIAIAAAQRWQDGDACEKPLGRNAAESRTAMVQAAVEAANVAEHGLVQLSPGAGGDMLAKQLIDEGRLGRIFHYRAKFLQDWTISSRCASGRAPATWRLDADVAGSGVTGDLLAHCVDTALLAQRPDRSAKSPRHDRDLHVKPARIMLVRGTDRRRSRSTMRAAFLARFNNGSLATFEATRYARGHKALYTLEINGEHGSIAWDLHDLHRLEVFDHGDAGLTRGWRSIHVTDSDHPYMKRWWVPGLQIGYEHSFIHQMADFLAGLDQGERTVPDFREALATDYVTDAVLRSARDRQWVAIADSR